MGPVRARFDNLVDGTAIAFDSVERELAAWRPEDVAGVLDEAQRLSNAGWWAFGFVAYEAAQAFDPGLSTAAPDPQLPLAWFAISRGPSTVPPVSPQSRHDYVSGPWTPLLDRAEHERAVGVVREQIAAGETYQCNLTTTLVGPVGGDTADLYRDLALGQRGRYNAYLDLGRHVVASASPELFFELAGPRLSMRPMKGTAARGRTTAEDEAALAHLTTSQKELAENVMIVDLVRNDMARIARIGSVAVRELCRPERYETVHQLTSEVTALVDPQAALSEIFGALFPCGSITGAPKRRTMEIITELEQRPRGIYCGAIGLIAPRDAGFRAEFSVAIRTVVVDRSTGRATYGTGGGITWDSQPAQEWAELEAKARVLHSRPEEFHLLETMRHDGDGIVKSVELHLDRVADSARYFGFHFDRDRARATLGSQLDSSPSPSRVRLRAYRSGDIGVDVHPLPVSSGEPVRLGLHPDPMDTTTCWSRHKTSLRGPYARRAESMPTLDDVLLSNERGEIMETSIGSVAALVDGVWVTPPLESGCLPGIERRRLIDDGTLRERTLTASDLRGAQSLAVMSSLRGWRDAVLIEFA